MRKIVPYSRLYPETIEIS